MFVRMVWPMLVLLLVIISRVALSETAPASSADTDHRVRLPKIATPTTNLAGECQLLESARKPEGTNVSVLDFNDLSRFLLPILNQAMERKFRGTASDPKTVLQHVEGLLNTHPSLSTLLEEGFSTRFTPRLREHAELARQAKEAQQRYLRNYDQFTQQVTRATTSASPPTTRDCLLAYFRSKKGHCVAPRFLKTHGALVGQLSRQWEQHVSLETKYLNAAIQASGNAEVVNQEIRDFGKHAALLLELSYRSPQKLRITAVLRRPSWQLESIDFVRAEPTKKRTRWAVPLLIAPNEMLTEDKLRSALSANWGIQAPQKVRWAQCTREIAPRDVDFKTPAKRMIASVSFTRR